MLEYLKIKDLFDYEDRDDESRILSKLNGLGFLKSDVIQFNGRCYGKKGLEKIASFGYAPRIVDKRKLESYFKNIESVEDLGDFI